MTQTILVTGASGFVAAWVVKEFLTAGYNVVGTVRSQSTADKVKATHAEYAGDRLSFAIVPDLAAPGAFDEAVKGVDGVVHTASPFILNATDFQKQLYHPAVAGTTSVLKAVKEFNPSVKRVVITSSFASVLDFKKGLRPGYTYTEADWNPMSGEEAIKDNDPVAAYLVSKTLAEHAAFDFIEKEKPNFSISTVTPPMVYGPLAQEFDSMSKLNESSADFYRLINGSLDSVPPTGFWAWADVRDLALAHRLAYESSEGANQRFLITNGTYSYDMFCDIAREKFPELDGRIPKDSKPLPEIYKLDNSKATQVLGIKWRSMEETVVDTTKSLIALEKKLASK